MILFACQEFFPFKHLNNEKNYFYKFFKSCFPFSMGIKSLSEIT